MAEQFLIPKRLTRLLPWLRGFAWRVETVFVRGAIWLLQRCSTETALRVSMRTLRLLGPLMPMWDRVWRNLAIAFADLPIEQRAVLRREIFSHLGAAIAELVLIERLWQQRAQRLEFEAHPDIEGIRAGGRPMVLVTGHIGAWQLTNFIAAQYDFPLTSLYAPESNPLMAGITFRLRDALPCTWIPSDGGVRRLIEELRAGRSVGLACDARLDQGEAVPYFGHPAMTNTVPARLALRQGCELVPVRVKRLPGARYHIRMEAPIKPRNTQSPHAEQAYDMSVQLNQRFEQWVRETPGEWMCLARRWPKDMDKAVRA